MKRLDAAIPPPASQPITLGMRVMHRLVRHWPGTRVELRNAGAIVTFTFDDVPDSAITEGAGLLEAAGSRGTFFVATSLFGTVMPHWRTADADAIAGLAERGHEIGLHSHRHRPAAHMGRRCFSADFDEAQRRLTGVTRSECYAYPFGFASPLHRAELRRRVRASRTTHPGINRGRVDPHALHSHAFGDTLSTPSAVDRLLDEASAGGGWLIFTGHDVDRNPSPYGCTPALLRHAIEGARDRSMAIAPMARALDLCDLPGRLS